MESFCTRVGISQEFSTPITFQQNGVIERKNRVIQEMARAMLHNKDVARNLWGEADNIACHTVNMCFLDPVPRRLHMSYRREGSQMLSISESLEVLVSFSRIEKMWKNLTPEAMKEYFWDTPL